MRKLALMLGAIIPFSTLGCLAGEEASEDVSEAVSALWGINPGQGGSSTLPEDLTLSPFRQMLFLARNCLCSGAQRLCGGDCATIATTLFVAVR